MTTYTTEDFANAEIARHPDGAVASRFGYLSQRQWRTVNAWLSDADMADQGWVPVREATDQPITLNALRRAWEGAERTSEYKAGDEVIVRYKADDFSVIRFSTDRVVTNSRFRLLHRAPKPEPWADLADVLRAHTGEPDPEETAKMLHERGVRVTEEMSAEYA